MNVSDTDRGLQALKRRTTGLALIYGLQFAILFALCLSLARMHTVEAAGSARVVRAQALIIEDEHGRARILLGAPLPGSRKERAKMHRPLQRAFPAVDR